MATEFEDALNEITGGNTATTPEIQQEQAAPTQSNAFDQALAEMPSASPEPSRDAPEPGGGMER